MPWTPKPLTRRERVQFTIAFALLLVAVAMIVLALATSSPTGKSIAFWIMLASFVAMGIVGAGDVLKSFRYLSQQSDLVKEEVRRPLQRDRRHGPFVETISTPHAIARRAQAILRLALPLVIVALLLLLHYGPAIIDLGR